MSCTVPDTWQDMDAFRQALKDNKLKATPQRIAVHHAMMNLCHASVEDVVRFILAERKTKVTVASVYNILNQLTCAGIYRSILSPANKMFFDVNPSQHIHLFNSQTNELQDVVDDDLVDYIQNYLKHRRFRGFKIDDVSVQLVGHSTRRH